jgi:uracil DNA glycosylase
MHHDLIPEMPDTGDLTLWAKQGVLLLNTLLTTKPGASNAHKLWAPYTTDLISAISKIKPVIFLLWGVPAKKYKTVIDSSCTILEYAHPSPAQTKQPFMLCPHFKEVNKLLSDAKETPINWNVVDEDDIGVSFGMHSMKQVIFTDGSAYPNKICAESKGGYGAVVVLGTLKGLTIYGNIQNVPYYATNQRAEGNAILKSLEFLNEHIDKWTECIIVTDSQFWIDMLEKYMPMWVAKGIDFSEKKNPDLTEAIYDIYTELKNVHNKEIVMRHIRSHNKNGWAGFKKNTYEYFCYIWNDYVDMLAKHARLNVEPGNSMRGVVEYVDDVPTFK